MTLLSNDLFQFGGIPANKFQLNVKSEIEQGTKESLL